MSYRDDKRREGKLAEKRERRAQQTPEQRELRSRQRCAYNHGLTLDEYDKLIADADGKCAICGETPYDEKRNGRAMIDHDHETGEIRGVLCRRCNSGIGLLGDDPALLEQAAAYLRKTTSL